MASSFLTMTRPIVTVPPPRQTAFGIHADAMHRLENTVLHKSVTDRFRDRQMPMDLILAIEALLRAYTAPEDHAKLLELTNDPEPHDNGHYKLWNLINLSPRDRGGEPVLVNSSNKLWETVRLLNGLSVWGIDTTHGVLEGRRAEQAKALLYASALMEHRVSFYPLAEHSPGTKHHALFLDDPEFAELLMAYPEHHERIVSTVIDRDSIDVDVLRALVTEGSLTVNEGML